MLFGLRPLALALEMLCLLAWVQTLPDTTEFVAADQPPTRSFTQFLAEHWVAIMTVVSVHTLWGSGSHTPETPARQFRGGKKKVQRAVLGSLGLLICTYVDREYAWEVSRNFLYALVFMTIVHAFGRTILRYMVKPGSQFLF